MNSFNYYLENLGEFGVVDLVNHPLVFVQGLPLAKPHEIVIFETGQIGEVFSMDRKGIEIMIFSKESIRVGTRVVRTDTHLSVPVGEEFLGSIIDALGEPMSEDNNLKKPDMTQASQSPGYPVNPRRAPSQDFLGHQDLRNLIQSVCQGRTTDEKRKNAFGSRGIGFDLAASFPGSSGPGVGGA